MKRFNKLFDRKIMVAGDKARTIEDQRELEDLGMRVEAVTAVDEIVVYEGYISKSNKNIATIFENYTLVVERG